MENWFHAEFDGRGHQVHPLLRHSLTERRSQVRFYPFLYGERKEMVLNMMKMKKDEDSMWRSSTCAYSNLGSFDD